MRYTTTPIVGVDGEALIGVNIRDDAGGSAAGVLRPVDVNRIVRQWGSIAARTDEAERIYAELAAAQIITAAERDLFLRRRLAELIDIVDVPVRGLVRDDITDGIP